MISYLVVLSASGKPREALRLARRLQALGLPVWVRSSETGVNTSTERELAQAMEASSGVVILVDSDQISFAALQDLKCASRFDLPVIAIRDQGNAPVPQAAATFELSELTSADLLDVIRPEAEEKMAALDGPPPVHFLPNPESARAAAANHIGGYRNPDPGSRWAIVLLAFALAVSLMETWHSIATFFLLDKDSPERLLYHASEIDFWSIVFLASTLIAGIPYLIWFNRSYKNLITLGNSDLQYTPAMATGGYFIPLANLYIPAAAMQTLWKGTDTSGSMSDLYAWKKSDGSILVGFWWAWWLAAMIVPRLARQEVQRLSHVTDEKLKADGFRSALSFYIFADLAQILAAICIIAIVVTIGNRMWDRYRRYSTEIAGVTPEPRPKSNWASQIVVGAILLTGLISVGVTHQSTNQIPPTEWHSVEQRENGFSVEMPGQMVPQGSLSEPGRHQLLASTPYGGFMVVEESSDEAFPSDLTFEQLKSVANLALKPLVEAVGKIQGEPSRAMVNGKLGVQMDFTPIDSGSGKKWTFGQAIFLLKGKHFFCLLAFGAPDKHVTDDAARFISSFRAVD